MTTLRDTPIGEDPWMAAMRRGDFAAAWEISDTVLASRRGHPCHDWPRHLQHIWRGEPLAGKRVLVRCYHGLGDTVQFIRLLPRVRAIARETIVWAQPELIPLLRTAAGIDRLLPLHNGTPEAEFDLDAELMELPHVLRLTLDEIPRDVPYLHAQPEHGPALSSGELNVGLTWRVSEWDQERSIPTALVTRLAQRGVTLHVLQTGSARAEWPRELGVFSGDDEIAELARMMRALDLVITPDSFPAHLAGALGVPVWTLLPTPANWRWIVGRDDTPWYPTMRLFWQERSGEWAPVVERVREALAQHVARAVPAGK